MGHVVLTEEFKAALCVKQGCTAMLRHDFDTAIQRLTEAVEFNPDDAYAHWNLGTSLLCQGHYVEGFREFEWRWKMWRWWEYGTVGQHLTRIRDEIPKWRGEVLTGKRLLFYNEMGYGDCIQQLRYVPLLQKLGARVTVLVEPPLLRLAQTLNCMVTDQYPVGVFDYRCSSFGVMMALNQSAEDIPNGAWFPLDCRSSGGTLGLVWSGRTQTEFGLTEFLSRLNPPSGCVLQSLQPGEVSPFVRPLPPGDFLSTARLMATMDHIVTVDTAAAHLAGAIGHPSVHLLVPYKSDWRWWRSSAWYPLMNVYRQREPGDWVVLFAMLREMLRRSL
jgi:hypothetical protein